MNSVPTEIKIHLQVVFLQTFCSDAYHPLSKLFQNLVIVCNFPKIMHCATSSVGAFWVCLFVFSVFYHKSLKMFRQTNLTSIQNRFCYDMLFYVSPFEGISSCISSLKVLCASFRTPRISIRYSVHFLSSSCLHPIVFRWHHNILVPVFVLYLYQ